MDYRPAVQSLDLEELSNRRLLNPVRERKHVLFKELLLQGAPSGKMAWDKYTNLKYLLLNHVNPYFLYNSG